MSVIVGRVVEKNGDVAVYVRKTAGIWFCIPDSHFTLHYTGSADQAETIAPLAFQNATGWKQEKECTTLVNGIKVTIKPRAQKMLSEKEKPAPPPPPSQPQPEQKAEKITPDEPKPEKITPVESVNWSVQIPVAYRGTEYLVTLQKEGNHTVFNPEQDRAITPKTASWYGAVKAAKKMQTNDI